MHCATGVGHYVQGPRDDSYLLGLVNLGTSRRESCIPGPDFKTAATLTQDSASDVVLFFSLAFGSCVPAAARLWYLRGHTQGPMLRVSKCWQEGKVSHH